MKALQHSKRGLSRSSKSNIAKQSLRQASSSSSPPVGKVVLGIRREDPGRLWERRCPVTPDAVNDLVRQGVDVLVQPCDRRIWKNEDFAKAGASINSNLAPANIVVGIKETPISELDKLTTPVDGRERTHVMFSHTAKGQLYNMPLLSRFARPVDLGLSSAPRLIDYELLTGENGKRVVGFGWFAGAAGVVEGLSASAHDFLSLGVSSPFLYLPRPYSHPSLEDMRKSLRFVGEIISTRGMPRSTGPCVITVTGNGNVATGALDLLQELPICFVKADALPSLVSDPDTDLRKIYVVHLPSSAYLTNKRTGGSFDRADYYSNPDHYESHFADKIAPYTTVLINGAGWSQGFPRLLTTNQLSTAIGLARNVGKGRFRTIADISCDISGGIEFVDRSCTIDDPFFYTDGTGKEVVGAKTAPPGSRASTGVQVMSIDILPSELPLDASKHFSGALKPYLGALVRQYKDKTTEEDKAAVDSLDRATIARGGKLLPKHQWLADLITKEATKVHEGAAGPVIPIDLDVIDGDKPDLDLGTDMGGLDTSNCSTHHDANGKSSASGGVQKRKKVLLLGSGMVAKPAVDEFLKRKDVDLVIASNNSTEAYQLSRDHERASVVRLDASHPENLSKLVGDADVVVSLLPAPLHPTVAELCIQHKKHLVTASYVSPAMRELDARAKAVDVLLLNEIGLDPGLDHCSAMDLRQQIEASGRRVVSFVSWCGGLPAPEDSSNPLGMKFSWSPRGLLSAALNDAQYKLRGKIQRIAGSDLLSSHVPSVPLFNGFALEGLANRDSLPYAETYGLGPVEGLHNLFRGTLRYKGFSGTLDAMRRLGLLSSANEDAMILDPAKGGWRSFGMAALQKRLDAKVTSPEDVLKVALGDSVLDHQNTTDALTRLSILPSPGANHAAEDLPPLPTTPLSPLDLLTTLLSHKLRYMPGERDMVILVHQMMSVPSHSLPTSDPAKWEDVHTHSSHIVTYGSEAGSAMSRTVGLPLAFAAMKVLDGQVHERGVKGPSECGKEVWRGVLDGMETVGMGMKERSIPGMNEVGICF
ncbi:hypothetical protein FRB95_000412 [Tulasnella sp. JGI-2019a]|nr:hypothetical protein FRB95_000412 [Tulasnella sp. JGI-2019a]